ncbi:MAG: single-stranded DNA-binding protein [Candidatus Thorarchaeota archaeon]|jgi:replication factor A1
MNNHKSKTIEVSIAGLEPGMKGVNITFKVMSTSEEHSVESIRDEGAHRVLDAVVGDSTATVLMPVWDETIDSIKEGETYTLTNGYAGLFKGSLRLHLGKFGSIASAEETMDEVNTELDMSIKDFNSSQ